MKTVAITDIRLTSIETPGRLEVWICLESGEWLCAISELHVAPTEGCIDHYASAHALETEGA